MKKTAVAVLFIFFLQSILFAQEAKTPPKIWSGNVAVGGEYQYGNTERTSYNASGELTRKTDTNKWTTKLLTNYASDTTGITARNTALGSKFDQFFTKKSYWYVSENLLTDEFQDLDLRSTTGAGIAYQFIDNKEMTLLGEVGAAYVTEDFIINPNETNMSARAAAQFKWTFGTAVFSDNLEVLPSLEDDSFLLRNEATLTNALGAGWSLKLSNIVQHDSDPVAGVKKTDVTWIMALQFAF